MRARPVWALSFACLVLGLFPWAAGAQHPFGFSSRTWGVDDGLPQSTPTRLLLDDAGFVWGGSFGGLFRFDGTSFRTFGLNEIPALGTNQVTALAPARSGGFWVSGGSGPVVRVVDGMPQEEVALPPDRQEAIRVLLETQDGTLWMWTYTEIFAFRDGVWTLLQRGAMPPWPGVSLAEVAPGEVVGGSDGGFFQITPDGLRWLREPPFDYSRRVLGLLPGPGGELWAGTEEGLALLVGTRRIPISGIFGTVELLVSAPDGALWVAGERGVWRLQGPGLDRPGQLRVDDLEVQAVPWGDLRPTSLVITEDGTALVGAVGGGITAITPKVGHLIALPELWDPDAPADYGDPAAHGVQADRLGRLWVNKDCGPLIRLDAFPGGVGPTASDTPRVGMRFPGCFRALAIGPMGDVWAADEQQILRISEQGRISSISTAEISRSLGGELPPSVITLHAPTADSLWVGTSDGRLLLYTLARGFEEVPGWASPVFGGVLSLVATAEGEVWAGGGAGEVRHRSRSGIWTILTRAHGIPPGPIRVIAPDPDGGLWVGSYGGGVVYRSPGGHTQPLPLVDGTLSALVQLEGGSLWIPQNTGLAVVKKATLEQVRGGDAAGAAVRRLRSQDGIPEVNNGRPAATLLPSGRIAIGTVEGLLIVDPTRLPPVAESPEIRVDRIRTPLRDEVPIGGRLALDRGERLLELDLSYPSFRASDPVRVRYRLVGRGYSGDWVVTPAPRVIQLTALRPGSVRVDLETALPGRAWAPAYSREIRALPHLWERRSAQASLLAIFLLLGFVTLQSQTRAQRAEAMALRERMRREAHAAAAAEAQRRELIEVGRQVMAGELSASLTHEVSQPITAISQTVKALRWEMDRGPVEPAVLDETVEDLLEQSQRARDIIQGLRRFLMEGEPNHEPVDMQALVEKVPELARHDLEAADVRVEFDFPAAIPEIRGERLLLQQVLMILVSNAIEASADAPKGAKRVGIRVRRRGSDGVRVSVCDRGGGVPRVVRRKIFEPFQSTKPGGMGMGLSIARRVVLAHGGRISLRSQEGLGTVASFWVPGKQPRSGKR
jgi:signal transduction histidine kinase/ligand-binding sensor domain-containing protein